MRLPQLRPAQLVDVICAYHVGFPFSFALTKIKNTFEMNNMQKVRSTWYLDALELFRSLAKHKPAPFFPCFVNLPKKTPSREISR